DRPQEEVGQRPASMAPAPVERSLLRYGSLRPGPLPAARAAGIMAGSGSPGNSRSCEPPLVPSGNQGLTNGQGTRRAAAAAARARKRPKDTEMPKIKTHRGAAKRFRKTASGKYKAGHANRSHILTKMAT